MLSDIERSVRIGLNLMDLLLIKGYLSKHIEKALTPEIKAELELSINHVQKALDLIEKEYPSAKKEG